MSVILETTIGDLVIDLFVDERPRACLNFLKLCKVKFYNYSLFHFVQRNFLAQTGDPSGTGRGGESIFRSLYGDQAKFFEAEIKPRIKHVKKGTVSMVNNGSDMHGSQFFITLGENLDYLDGKHTVFGEVAEGFDILDKLNEAICDDDHRPYQDIRITHTVILDDPYDDPAGLKVPDRSPEPTKEQLDSGRIGADEEIDETKGKTIEEVEEMIEEREHKAGTQILEMVGDIPDADIKPPENVLFVCKLNPVTTDEDLEIIFSRFGPIKSCEIIKDSVSNESLQYAFIEYENVEDCERAYFKMDNVLIDDRRIHVDFSQSVSKLVYSKPGSKPVFELKENVGAGPKLKIKDSSRKEKYDLVFERSDSGESCRDDEKNNSDKHSKKKKDYKKQHRESSKERSPEDNRTRSHRDQENSSSRHGNRRRGNPADVRGRGPAGYREMSKEQDSPGNWKSKEKHRSRMDSKREDRREDKDRRDMRGHRRERVGGSPCYTDSDDDRRRYREHAGKSRDRDVGAEERYGRRDRDKRRDTEQVKSRDEYSDDRYARDSRDRKNKFRDDKGDRGRGNAEENSSMRRSKQRSRLLEQDSEDNSDHVKAKDETMNKKDIVDNLSSSEDGGSEEERRRRKRKTKEKKHHKHQKKSRRHSSESDS